VLPTSDKCELSFSLNSDELSIDVCFEVVHLRAVSVFPSLLARFDVPNSGLCCPVLPRRLDKPPVLETKSPHDGVGGGGDSSNTPYDPGFVASFKRFDAPPLDEFEDGVCASLHTLFDCCAGW
jgi:hypothetical protein